MGLLLLLHSHLLILLLHGSLDLDISLLYCLPVFAVDDVFLSWNVEDSVVCRIFASDDS